MEIAKLKIVRPDGCDKTDLSVTALDKYTRDLAWQTFVYVDGKQLLCRGLKIVKNSQGEELLRIDIDPQCFEFGALRER